MQKFSEVSVATRLFLFSSVYLLILITSLWWGPVIWSGGPHFPVLFELIIKTSAILAFSMVVLLPLLSVVTYIRKRKKPSIVLVMTACVLLVGYILLAGQLMYVKLKTCDANAIPYDDRWHCQYDGKGVVVYFVLITVLAGIVAIATAVVEWIVKRSKRS